MRQSLVLVAAISAVLASGMAKADGIFGPSTPRVTETVLADGIFGPSTPRVTETVLADGIFGPSTPRVTESALV